MRFALVWLACNGPSGKEMGLVPGDSGDLGCQGYDWDTVGAPYVFTWCTTCHSSTTPDRQDAPAGVDFDTYEATFRWATRIEQRAVVDRTMPPMGGPFEDEVAIFARWLDCGALE